MDAAETINERLDERLDKILDQILAILRLQEHGRLLAQTQIPVNHPQRPGDAF